ncbi:Extracellular solute-binding protein family 5 [Candidatus Roizmanbacteria bacterium]|nr:Extracellular solute-binding protein family 5 [Candidatus Roizmanbacteria bacterium]
MSKKTFRYYYWLLLEFIKKYSRLILMSFFIGFISLIGFLSVSPYLKSFFNKQESIGLVGKYDFTNLPDEVMVKVSNGLININEKGEIVPVLANSWEVKDGGKQYRFYLKNNLLWNDDKKFTASDVNYQFNDVKIKVVDKNVLDFYLNKPLGIFPTYLSKALMRPPLIGIAGFYKLGKYKMLNGSLVDLTLVPNTKDLMTIKYKFYSNESDLVTAYKKGEINKMTLSKKSVADTFINWKNSEIIKSVDHTRLLTLFFNNKGKTFSNKDIKDAFAMMMDYQKLSNFGEIARGPISPASWAYNSNLKTNSYDIDTATKIVKKDMDATESGQLNLLTSYDYYDAADSIAGEIKKTGLKVDINMISYDLPDNFDLLLVFWNVPKDPDQYYFWHSTQIGPNKSNISNYQNVKVDKLLEEGRSTVNIEERSKFYQEFQKIIQDDPPALFLYYPYVYTIKRK